MGECPRGTGAEACGKGYISGHAPGIRPSKKARRPLFLQSIGWGTSLKETAHLMHIQKNDKLQGSGWQGLPPDPHGSPVESLSEIETQTPPLELLKKVFIP